MNRKNILAKLSVQLREQNCHQKASTAGVNNHLSQELEHLEFQGKS